MTACLALIGLLVACTAEAPLRTAATAAVDAPAPAPPPQLATDRWVAEDKVQHAGVSFAATGFAYAVARFHLDPRPARLTAAALALAAGLGKEAADRRKGRRFSLKDLAWDVAGVAAGLALVNGIR